MKSKKEFVLPSITVVILLIIDQLTKWVAVINLKEQPNFDLIKDVFVFEYLENRSAAFSLDPITLLHKIFHFNSFDNNPDLFLRTKMIFFVVLTIVVVALIIWIYRKIPNTKRFRLLNYTIVLFTAGALGNCIDRVWHNYVVDFLYFKLIDFPVFNVADIYVTISAIAFFILIIFYYKDDDFKLIFPNKKNKEK